jgi:hypothetical protein
MFSRRELEGYVMVDHRESPGFTPQEAAQAGFRNLPVGKGTKFQGITYRCSHCEAQIVLEIKNRDKSPGHCSKCDRNLCKRCALVWKLTGVCRPFNQIIDEMLTKGTHHGA